MLIKERREREDRGLYIPRPSSLPSQHGLEHRSLNVYFEEDVQITAFSAETV
jgi:hypothetical protein